jgi:hypothetical protein
MELEGWHKQVDSLYSFCLAVLDKPATALTDAENVAIKILIHTAIPLPSSNLDFLYTNNYIKIDNAALLCFLEYIPDPTPLFDCKNCLCNLLSQYYNMPFSVIDTIFDDRFFVFSNIILDKTESDSFGDFVSTGDFLMYIFEKHYYIIMNSLKDLQLDTKNLPVINNGEHFYYVVESMIMNYVSLF